MPDDTNRSIEEGTEVYRPGGFHPVYIGDILNERYKIFNKIGYGVYSTVWLIRDLKLSQYVRPHPGPENEFLALKIPSAQCYDGSQAPIFEREILTHLRNGDRDQLGYNHVCHLLDDFEHIGPNGMHVCLVFELMGETLRSFGAWFFESRLPNSVMRRFAIQLLLVLDFAHEHNVIHTDIKPDNIFVKFRDYSLIESGYLTKVAIPTQDRAEERYTVIPSTPLRRYYFDDADSAHAAEFDIALGDWGVSSWADRHLSESIQPIAPRASEVLIRAPWDASTDFWNLGAIVLEIFRAVRMFSGAVPPDGHYEVKEHLAEIVHLFRTFPRELLERGDQDLVWECFGADGTVKDALELERPELASEAFMPGLDQEVREEFADWLRVAMKINPAERASAEELLRHPWLGALQ
ncbi:kinase-like domain-containing protein [Aspergillus pseudoustus]|uniref:non-specific serine/threonine protein kinase n=1 Tax=Aspergillus pseudoustus TaxID=1810923 RepID=A0ABR4K259_9EURO